MRSPRRQMVVSTSARRRTARSTRSIGAASRRRFFNPAKKDVWALASDARGQLYAATGDKGTVYKIAPDGKGAKFYQAQSTNVTSLAIDRSGALLVGTEAPGRVLKVDADGKAFLLLDTPFEEIRSLRFDDKGVLYVAAVNGRGGSVAAPRADDRDTVTPRAPEPSANPVPSVSAEITSIAVVDAPSGGASIGAAREDRRTPKGAIYRIAADGLWDKLWESREDSPYDVVFDAQGKVVIGTGNRGKLYRLEGDPLQPTLVTTAGGQQVTSLHRDGKGRIYYATANPGKLYRLSAERAAKGTYESETRDAGMVATWGAISWRGTTPPGSRIEVSTRSGNTDTPNDTWSAVVVSLRRRGRLADQQPQGAIHPVAGGTHRQRDAGSHVGHRRVSAAESAARGPVDHGPSAGDRVPEAVQHRRS